MELLYVVVGMALVTYIPRMLPLVLLQKIALPAFVRRFMRFIPYAALGALIFPGALFSTGEGNALAASVGCLTAMVLAWRAVNLVFVVLGGVAGAFLVNTLLSASGL